MTKYCTFVGLILAVFVSTTTTLPVKSRDHDVEDSGALSMKWTQV